MQIEKFSTTCVDGVILKGKLIIADSPKAIIQFNAGTAAIKEFYQPFLEYLAEHGYASCLWDYRGNGESAPKSLKGCEYTFSDYGLKDMPAIRDFLKGRFPDLPLLLIGHSAGGQQAGLISNLEDYKGMLAIAVSTGNRKQMRSNYKPLANFFFNIFSPISIALTGYVKAKPFGIMENLPKNVLREWGDWCLEKDYIFSSKYIGKTIPKGSYESMPFPIEVIWTPDDSIATEQNTNDLWANIHSEQGINFTRIDASDITEKEIGHFGFFKRRMKDKIWPVLLEKLKGLAKG